jgi:hypothetical protein
MAEVSLQAKTEELGEKACRNETTSQNLIYTALEWNKGLSNGRPVSNSLSQGRFQLKCDGTR